MDYIHTTKEVLGVSSVRPSHHQLWEVSAWFWSTPMFTLAQTNSTKGEKPNRVQLNHTKQGRCESTLTNTIVREGRGVQTDSSVWTASIFLTISNKREVGTAFLYTQTLYFRFVKVFGQMRVTLAIQNSGWSRSCTSLQPINGVILSAATVEI